MSIITFVHHGKFEKTEKLLKRSQRVFKHFNFNEYGDAGLAALRENTPHDSNITADAWSYEIIQKRNEVRIVWNNSNIVDGVPIAVIIQYGHGTRNGGYVEGRDYINPALQPIFDQIVEAIWKEVHNS